MKKCLTTKIWVRHDFLLFIVTCTVGCGSDGMLCFEASVKMLYIVVTAFECNILNGVICMYKKIAGFFKTDVGQHL